jgi:hypothetical protein
MTRCTVCNAPARDLIEAGLWAGVSKSELARQHGVSRYAIIDHARAHMPTPPAEAPGPAPGPGRDRWAPPEEPCIICAHPLRQAIEAVLKTETNRVVIAQRWRIPVWAVIQHVQAHMVYVPPSP